MTAFHNVAAGCAALFPLGSLAAQAVSVSVSALTPLVVQMTSGAQTAQNSLPPGVLPPTGNVSAVARGDVAYASWFTHVGDTEAVVQLANNLFGNSVGVAAAGSAGPHEFLVQFTALGPAPAALELTRATQLTTGIPWPTADVDIDNDGTIDIVDVTFATISLPSFGTQPCSMRVILAASLPSSGTSATQVQLTLRPQNNLVVSRTALGCAPPNLAYGFEVAQAFAGSGVALTASSFDPMVLVLGLAQQPLLLPSSTLGPCLVVPLADLLLAPPPHTPTIVPLPAAVRPLTLQVQAVGINMSGLLTTDAFSVFAY